LLADWLVRAGKLDDGVAAWEAAGHPHHHTGIDFAICEIYGGPSPLRRRGDLIEKYRNGDTQLAEKLIDQDLHMDQDWWNTTVSQKGLKHDLPLVEKATGGEGERFEQIRCWVDLTSKQEP